MRVVFFVVWGRGLCALPFFAGCRGRQPLQNVAEYLIYVGDDPWCVPIAEKNVGVDAYIDPKKRTDVGYAPTINHKRALYSFIISFINLN